MVETPGHPGARRSLLIRGLALAAALLAYAGLLVWYNDPYAGGSDTSGYLNHARLLTEGRLHTEMRTIEGLPPSALPPDAYTPLGLKPAPDGNGLVPTYASGLPLMLAGVSRLVGWDAAATLVIAGHALLGMGITFLLARRLGLAPSWAGIATAIVTINPLYFMYSVQIMSDVPSLTWVGAALLAAWDAGAARDGRTGFSRALVAGFCISVAVLIRPNSLIALVPMAFALGASPRRWATLALGGLPGALFFCAHSRAAYGSALVTGYGHVGYLFSRRYIIPTLENFGTWTLVVFTPLVLPVLGLPWKRGLPARSAAVIGSTLVVYLCFYAPYQPSHEAWWYLRFLMPAAPALVTGGLLVACDRLDRRGGARMRAFILLLVVLNGAFWTRHFLVLKAEVGDRDYPRSARWLVAHAPPRAVVAAAQVSGSFYYYTPFVLVRWDLVDSRAFTRIEDAAKAEGRPLYAALFPHERAAALGGKMPGLWSEVYENHTVSIWRWEGGDR